MILCLEVEYCEISLTVLGMSSDGIMQVLFGLS